MFVPPTKESALDLLMKPEEFLEITYLKVSFSPNFITYVWLEGLTDRFHLRLEGYISRSFLMVLNDLQKPARLSREELREAYFSIVTSTLR